jgi:two-component system, NarL family, response regulator NreC
MVRISAQRRARVLVVDDHSIVREGVTLLLERDAAVEVVGGAATGREAVLAAKRLQPDIVVMDLVLRELSGVDVAERILADLPHTRIVIFTIHVTSEHVFRALRAGALAYVDKNAPAADLVRAVNEVSRGGQYLSAAVANSIERRASESDTRSPLERLSIREREVLHLTAGGATSAQIAKKLSLSPKTVDTYRSRIMEKLAVHDHAALIRFAIEHALIPS